MTPHLPRGRRIEGIDEILAGISSLIPDISPAPDSSAEQDPFRTPKRKAWNSDNPGIVPRCELRQKISFQFRSPSFGVHTQYDRSLTGPSFDDIKSGDRFVEPIARDLAALIRKTIGEKPDPRDWIIVTAPRRRHKERNFATLLCDRISRILQIPFLPDLFSCSSRQRVNPTFNFSAPLPPQRNIMAIDDILTTGSTTKEMRRLLILAGYNPVFFAAINNRKPSEQQND
ncbi:MAG: hypothetical protein HDS14_05970 [Bacteroides sp.]|nr:hypothetical protein [Bacteroides sp.]